MSFHGHDFSEWIRWVISGVAGATAVVADLIRRHIRKSLDAMGEQIKDRDEKIGSLSNQIEELDDRMSHVESEQELLKLHIENGSHERAEIKKAIGKVDGKIDKISDHLIKK